MVNKIRELERATEREKDGEKDWRMEMELRIQKVKDGGGSRHDPEERIQEIENRLETKEKKDRRNNIIIKGARFNEVNIKEEVARFIEDRLNVKERIVRALKLRNKDSNRRDIVLVVLESRSAKINVMKAKHNLRGSNIYIEDDWTRREREIQKGLRDLAKSTTQKGGTARVAYMKIEIDGKWLNLHQANELWRQRNFQQDDRRAKEGGQ